MGDIHFAIHPLENFKESTSQVGSVKMAFEVFDIQAFVMHLKSKGVEPLYPIKQMGPMQITALNDPDGNHVEFTQLGTKWITHLEKRRAMGHDLVSAFKRNQTL